MARCAGREKLNSIATGAGGWLVCSSDWFESDDPEAKGNAIRRFVRRYAEKTKQGKPQEACAGDCGNDKTRDCLPYSLSVVLPKDSDGWFKGVSTELDGTVYEAYLVKFEDAGELFVMSTKCRCTSVDF